MCGVINKTKVFRRLDVIFFLLGSVLFYACSTVVRSQDEIEEKNDLASAYTKHGMVSFLIADVDSGIVIAEENSQRRLTPASLTKIFTTGAALLKLGSDYSFVTDYYFRAKTRDFVIKGGGDPTYGSMRFEMTKPEKLFSEILTVVKREGIDGIQDLIIDQGIIGNNHYPSKRIWEDMSNYYGVAPCGLSFAENTFYLTLQSPSRVGKRCSVKSVNPDVDLDFTCDAVAANNTKDSAYIYGHPELKTWHVSGSIPKGQGAFTIKGAMPKPWSVFGNQLRNFFQKNGVNVAGSIRIGNVLETDKKLGFHTSPKLSEIVKVINKKSHNLYADHTLLALLGDLERGFMWDQALKEMSKIWRDKNPEFTGSFYDGSGLSPLNVCSASDMVNVLTVMHHSDEAKSFYESLAIAGKDGTLKTIFTGEDVKGKVLGKSGSMTGVLAYAGFIHTDSGKTLAFCIMYNNFDETYKEIRNSVEALISPYIRTY